MSEENVEIVRRYLEKGLDTMSPEGLPRVAARPRPDPPAGALGFLVM